MLTLSLSVFNICNFFRLDKMVLKQNKINPLKLFSVLSKPYCADCNVSGRRHKYTVVSFHLFGTPISLIVTEMTDLNEGA